MLVLLKIQLRISVKLIERTLDWICQGLSSKCVDFSGGRFDALIVQTTLSVVKFIGSNNNDSLSQI